MEVFKGLRAVVTGGAGFIGSHLVEKLLDLGTDVVVLDNFTYGDKIAHLRGRRGLCIYRGDVKDIEIMSKIVKDADVIFHFASIVGVEEAYQQPVKVLNVEVQGTIDLLDSLLDNDAKRVVFASSSEVYGDSPSSQSEEDSAAPKSIYGYAKLIGEKYCEAYHQQHNIEYVCLRYFNVYGPRQDERFVIPRFIKRVLRDKPPLVYGNGNQIRDFTYIEDAVNMTLLAALKPEASCESLNVGTGVGVTINELAHLVIRTLGKENLVKLRYITFDEKRPRDIEIFDRTADVSKAARILGYKSRVSLEEGIGKISEVHRHNGE